MSPELLEKALACKTAEELIALAKSEGYDFTDEQIEAIAGGSFDSILSESCPEVGCLVNFNPENPCGKFVR